MKKKNIQSIRNVTLSGLGDRIAYKQGLWTVIVPANSHCSAVQGMSVRRTMRNYKKEKKQTNEKIKAQRHCYVCGFIRSVILK